MRAEGSIVAALFIEIPLPYIVKGLNSEKSELKIQM